MELIDKKVYRLDIGDFYSVIDFGGSSTIYGFSQDSAALLEDTIEYARRYKHGSAKVSVFCRRSLGCASGIVSVVTL